MRPLARLWGHLGGGGETQDGTVPFMNQHPSAVVRQGAQQVSAIHATHLSVEGNNGRPIAFPIPESCC